MTDITELAQRMKAAAEKLDADQWQTRKGFSGIEVIVKGSLEKGTGCVSFQPVAADIADTKTARAIALFSPANVLALVEALEKAQADGNEYAASERAVAAKNVELQDEIYGLNARIAELESRTVSLPPRVDSSNVPFAAHTWSCCLDEVEKRLTAAGIKWEDE